MKHTIRRALVVLFSSAGLIGITAAAAQASVDKLAGNHTEPVATSR